MAEPTKKIIWLKRLAILPPLAIGVAILVLVVRGREPPSQIFAERVIAVRAIRIPVVAMTPRAIGYGTVAPGRAWKAVAQVEGRIVTRHERLESGEILPAGALLLGIDPSDYRLAVAEIEANIQGAEAELKELDAERSNQEKSRAIERRKLAIAERELKRKQGLRTRGNVSVSDVDRAQQDLLVSRRSLQDINNALNLLPAGRGVLRARLRLYRAQLESARLDLARTRIEAPFPIRIGAVNVEAAQFVRAGEVLAEASGIAVAEIAAQFPIDRLFPLVPPEVDPGSITPETLGTFQHMLGLRATVRLRAGRLAPEWRARFARLDAAIDPQTRTIGVIVAVDDPYRKAKPGLRPALVKGMFVEVELHGKVRPGMLVVPRSALHGGADGTTLAYVVDADERPRRKPVTIAFAQDDFVVVASGLAAGERVVVSDPVPAIDGMKLDVTRDETAEARLRRQASGQAP